MHECLHNASLKVGNREEGSAPDISPQASRWSGPQFMEMLSRPQTAEGRQRGTEGQGFHLYQVFPFLLSAVPFHSEKFSRGAGTCAREKAHVVGDEGEHCGGLKPPSNSLAWKRRGRERRERVGEKETE